MYEGLASTKQRADAGDARACIELGDHLLARAPYASVRWESDSQWQGLRNDLGFANFRANDAFASLGEAGAHGVDGTRDYLAWEGSVSGARLALEQRVEQLGSDTPGRAAFLEAALHYHHRAAQLGDPAGMVRLGWRHMLGQGTPIDEDAAAYWWKQAAAHGDGAAADVPN